MFTSVQCSAAWLPRAGWQCPLALHACMTAESAHCRLHTLHLIALCCNHVVVTQEACLCARAGTHGSYSSRYKPLVSEMACGCTTPASTAFNLSSLRAQIEFGTRVSNIQLPAEPGQRLVVTTTRSRPPKDSGKSETRCACGLLIGADGYTSHVRSALDTWQPDGSWAYQEAPSPSGDLAWKVRTRGCRCAAVALTWWHRQSGGTCWPKFKRFCCARFDVRALAS